MQNEKALILLVFAKFLLVNYFHPSALVPFVIQAKAMIKAVRQKGIVGKQGKIEFQTPELSEGTEVEIIVLVPDSVLDSEGDTTEYLLSTTANRRELLEAIERVDDRDNLVTISSEEWHEKYCL